MTLFNCDLKPQYIHVQNICVDARILNIDAQKVNTMASIVNTFTLVNILTPLFLCYLNDLYSN